MVRISPVLDGNARTSLAADAPAPFASLGSDLKIFSVVSVREEICAKGLSVKAFISIRSRYCSVSLSKSDGDPASAGTGRQGAFESGTVNMLH
jgi:hypothetical protein